MVEIWVIFCGSIPRLLPEVLFVGLVVVEGLVVVVGTGLLRYQRKARKPTIATAISWGMLIEVCVSAILAGRGFGAS